MVVTIKNCETIRSKDPTWFGCVALSEWDQIGYVTHLSIIYFYQPPQNSLSTIASTLKHSLSKILVPFYPLAGRLHWIQNARLELHCNNKGAHFIEAESSLTFQDLNDFSPSSEHHHQLVPTIDYTIPFHDLPLLIVQLTTFKCGGISISFTISHAVVDGSGAFHFINEWARFTRGEPLQTLPFHDRKVLRAGEQPSLIECHVHTEFDSLPLLLESDKKEERKKKTTMVILQLSKTQVETLKKTANESSEKPKNGRGYTRYESVTGHIWRSASKARGHRVEQPTSLTVIVDSRSRMEPPLPKGYFGNATLDVVASSVAGELVTKSLGYVCGRIRDAIEKVNDAYVKSGIEFLKRQDDLRKFQQDVDVFDDDDGNNETFFWNPNLAVVSWLTLPVYGVDFGWGKEVYMGPAKHDFDGDFVLLPGPHGDESLLLVVGLQMSHMDAFKKHFYEDIA